MVRALPASGWAAAIGIIDLAGGDQPIHNETARRRRRNGEIYNYRELAEPFEVWVIPADPI